MYLREANPYDDGNPYDVVPAHRIVPAPRSAPAPATLGPWPVEPDCPGCGGGQWCACAALHTDAPELAYRSRPPDLAWKYAGEGGPVPLTRLHLVLWVAFAAGAAVAAAPRGTRLGMGEVGLGVALAEGMVVVVCCLPRRCVLWGILACAALGVVVGLSAGVPAL